MDPRPRAAVVTISDGVTHGTREDASGDLASELVAAAGFEVAERVVIPDERDRIEDTIRDPRRDARRGDHHRGDRIRSS